MRALSAIGLLVLCLCAAQWMRRSESQTPSTEINPEPANSIQKSTQNLSKRKYTTASNVAPMPASTDTLSDISTPHDRPAETSRETDETGVILHDSFSPQDAFAAWEQEKLDFYRGDLELSEEEIASLQQVTEESGNAVSELAKDANSALEQDDANVDPLAVRRGTDRIVGEYNTKIYNLLGRERFDRVIAFRDSFNAKLHERFATDFSVARF